jgi:DNA-directed RNA polymerase subunit F
MTKAKLINEQPVSMAFIRKHLEEIKKRDGELNFRGTKCEDYLNTVVDLKFEESVKLEKDLEGLKIPRLKPEHIIKIIDIMPQSVEELKVVLQGYVLSVNQSNMKKIVDTVKNYVKE